VAASTTKLVAFAEFEQLPDPQPFRYELRHGELVQVAGPKWKHYMTQRRLRRLLENAAADTGIVEIEFGFRALVEYEYRRADVAYVFKDRCADIDPNGYFQGAPDIVIEVLSPSNTIAEMLDKEKLCLENGSREFWMVDIDRRQIKVSTPDGHTMTYKSGQEIPLLFGGRLTVDAIFS
jgi:Uma2 family endonuclease